MKNKEFIETKNAVRIINTARYCVESGFNLAILGSPGIGKSTICNRIDELFSKSKTVIRLTAIKNSNNRTDFYLKLLLRTIDVSPEAAPERCYTQVQEHFPKLKNPVILLINEAQNINIATLKGLKNIWEVTEGKLCVILFGLPDGNFQRALDGSEIGDRLLIEEMELLEKDEVIAIAKKNYGLTFKGAKSQALFCETARGLPSKIEKLAISLKSIRNFDGIVNEDSLEKSKYMEVKRIMRLARIDASTIAVELNKEGVRTSVNEVHNVLSGKETRNKDAIDSKAEEIMARFGLNK